MPGPTNKEPKLSRKQITDILQRNLMLYREEPNLAEYIAELALYLIEYQYDPELTDEALPDLEDDIPAPISSEGGRVLATMATWNRKSQNSRNCPVCGVLVEVNKPCPGCGIRFK